MNIEKLTHPAVRKAIEALQAGDKKAWFALFTDDALLYDDGRKMDFRSFFDKALGHERFTSIDKVEQDGLAVYGNFHSDQWGDFKTYFIFRTGENGQFTRVDIGQTG